MTTSVGKLRAARYLIAAIIVAAPTPVLAWLVLQNVVRHHTVADSFVITLGCVLLITCRAGIELWNRWLAHAELEEVRRLYELSEQLCARIDANDRLAREIAVQVGEVYANLRLLVNNGTMRRYRDHVRPDVVGSEEASCGDGGGAQADMEGVSRVVVLDMARPGAQQRERQLMPPSVEHSTPST
jgi:hypothetical protein